MRKRLLSVLLSAAMIGTIAGSAMPVMADDKEDIRVAGVVYLEDQFMKLMLAGYEAAADEALDNAETEGTADSDADSADASDSVSENTTDTAAQNENNSGEQA